MKELQLKELINEVPADLQCPYCYAPLKIVYARSTPSLELWVYKCSGFCDNHYARICEVHSAY